MAGVYDLVSWNKTLAQVLQQNNNTSAIGLLLRGLEQLIKGSSGLVTVYPPTGKPQTTHQRLLANENQQLQIDKYASGAYLLDPFYCQAVGKSGNGVFTIANVAPAGFEQSEYYHLFYQQLGFRDEICCLFQLEQQHIVSISLVRHCDEAAFSSQDVKQLTTVFPLLKAIVSLWLAQDNQPQSPALEWQLDQALASFGQSVLTPRECKILQLILHGYAIKVIAQKLENSLETIKHHRKNIYLKLDISSQAELFYLFITSLKAMPHNCIADPLTFMK